MLRAFHPQPVPADAETLTLAKEESFHLAKVLRAGANEPVSAFDGRGNFFTGKIVGGNANALTISIEKRENVPAPRCRISLAQALPKGSLTDDIVRQATEIGAARIFPILSARCEVKLDATRAAHKLERWRAIAIEACKQSGNPFLPEICEPIPLKKFLEMMREENARENTLMLTASLESATRECAEIARENAKSPPEEVLWLVGPEGDFTEEEYALARESGFAPARLGGNVLRAITASIYVLAVSDQFRRSWFPAPN